MAPWALTWQRTARTAAETHLPENPLRLFTPLSAARLGLSCFGGSGQRDACSLWTSVFARVWL